MAICLYFWGITFSIYSRFYQNLCRIQFGIPVFSRKEDSKVKVILVKIDPFYKPSENEQLVMNPVKRTSSPITSLFVENRALSTIMFWITFFMSLIMIYGLNTWLPKLMNEAGYPLGSSLTFLLALNIGATVGSVLMGWLADRWGAKNPLSCFILLPRLRLLV